MKEIFDMYAEGDKLSAGDFALVVRAAGYNPTEAELAQGAGAKVRYMFTAAVFARRPFLRSTPVVGSSAWHTLMQLHLDDSECIVGRFARTSRQCRPSQKHCPILLRRKTLRRSVAVSTWRGSPALVPICPDTVSICDRCSRRSGRSTLGVARSLVCP
jgi:hypothetical protein